MIEVAIASVEAVFDWKEYQSRLQAVKKSTKRKKVAEEMRKSGMTAPLPIVDPANAKKRVEQNLLLRSKNVSRSIRNVPMSARNIWKKCKSVRMRSRR